MPRWRQDSETGKLVQISEGPAEKHASTGGVLARVDIDNPYVSPVDGSVIRSRKGLEEHNRRNNVVLQADLDEGHYRKARQERENLFTGKKSRQESLETKMFMYEQMMRAERNGN